MNAGIREKLGRWLLGGAAAPEIRNDTPAPLILRGTSLHDVFSGGSTGAGNMPVLNERGALAISAIYACVNLIAGAIASLPLLVYAASREGERDLINGHPLSWVFNEEMSPRWMAHAGWEFLLQSLLLHGDAFALILRGPDSMPIGLTPIHPSRVVVALNTVEQRLVYGVAPEVWTGKGARFQDIYDQDDVLHIPGFGFDGLRGLSPLAHALRMSGGVAHAAQTFAGQFFKNSARPDYVLVSEKPVGADTIDTIRSQIEEKHTGADNWHRPMVLSGGLDVKNLTMPSDQMQVVEQRKFQIEEIARIFGVPPFMIGHNEKTTSWGSGIQGMSIGFVRYTLKPVLNRIHNEANRKLFRTATRFCEFDTSDLERADPKTLMESLRTAVGRAGEDKLMSQNEARRVLKLKPVEGGDETRPAKAAEPAPGEESEEPAPKPGAPDDGEDEDESDDE